MPKGSRVQRNWDRNEASGRPRRRKRRSRRPVWIGGGLAAVCLIAALVCLIRSVQHKEPPVISGVREEIELTEGDDLRVLLDGVTADWGGESVPVTVVAYDEAGTEISISGPRVYYLKYTCDGGGGPVESRLTIHPADTEGPVFSGLHDIEVEVGATISYREGVSAEDAVDGPVAFQVDADEVDLNKAGVYTVTYFAVDAAGNQTGEFITVTVTQPESADPDDPDNPGGENNTGTTEDFSHVTQADVDALADGILAKITNHGMTQKQKAKAIFDYVYSNIKYTGNSDKSSWIVGAYVGFTRGRGDCYNYFACSKALLTRAGIPNVDLQRVGGNSRHYWQLVNVGDGWYHFDACWLPRGYPLNAFLMTEEQVRAYTKQFADDGLYKNYYTYDYDSCPVEVVGTPADDASPAPTSTPAPVAVNSPAVTEPPAAVTDPPAPATETPEVEPSPAVTEPPVETADPPVESGEETQDGELQEEDGTETSGQEEPVPDEQTGGSE